MDNIVFLNTELVEQIREDELFDLASKMIRVNNRSHVFTVLGVIHESMDYLPFDDYMYLAHVADGAELILRDRILSPESDNNN
jgi:hypothetical protein